MGKWELEIARLWTKIYEEMKSELDNEKKTVYKDILKILDHAEELARKIQA